VVLPDLQGKGHVRQRSISADLMLSVVVYFFIGTHYLAPLGLVTLYQDKVTALAAIERSTACLDSRVSSPHCISQTFFVSLSIPQASPAYFENCKQGCLVKGIKQARSRLFPI
jgi:hypothetical protein